MIKHSKIFLLVLMAAMFFSTTSVSANSEVFPVHSGTTTYYKYVSIDHYLGWGVDIDTRIRATSRYSGAGSSPLYLDYFYTDEISSYGTDTGEIKKSWTTVYDSYNNVSYDYNTFCHILYNAQTININKYLGWSDSKNPYVQYDIAPDQCGGNYQVLNHFLVNNY